MIVYFIKITKFYKVMEHMQKMFLQHRYFEIE